MLRLIARQYLTGLKEHGTDKKHIGSSLFQIIYIFFVLPSLWQFFNSKTKALIYLSLAIPMGWTVMESVFCPIRMSKMMFLCPMDAEMRQRYIRGTYRFKVVLHTALGTVGALMTLALGNDWLGALGIIFNVLLLSIFGVGVDTLFSGNKEDNSDTSNWGRLAVRIIGMILVFILLLVDTLVANDGGMLALERWEQILIGCLKVLALLFAIGYVGYWKTMQKEALQYVP